jgi:hypothetical protein
MILEDQRENSRREYAKNEIEKKTGVEKEKAQKEEDDRVRKWEDTREKREMSSRGPIAIHRLQQYMHTFLDI